MGGCTIDMVADFDMALRFLNDRVYGAAIIDIMGVNGYKLLRSPLEKILPQ